jgi:hypothetical protein
MTDRPAFGAHIVTGTLDRELKQARIIFLVIGLMTIVVGLISLITLSDQIRQAEQLGLEAEIPAVVRFVFYIQVEVGAVYLLLALLVYKRPILTTITGLVIYSAFTLVDLAVAPVPSLFGVGLRAAMLIALVSAVRFAFLYERNRTAKS